MFHRIYLYRNLVNTKMAAELLSKGNNEFVNENYQKAIELYTEAIGAEPENEEAYCCRAQAYIKFQQYKEAVEDSNSAIKLKPNSSIAYMRKGVALFHQEEYTAAKEAFSLGQTFNAEDNNFRTWIRKCEAEIDMSNPSDPQQVATPQVGTSSGDHESGDKADNTKPAPVPMPAGPKTKYDWYQTETHTVVTILLKKVKKEDCQVNIQDHSLSATVKLPTGNDYSLELDLAHQVLPDKSTTKIMSTKIEIKMRKAEAKMWTKLEDDGTVSKVKQINVPVSDDAIHKYPSSSHYTKNWDKLVSDIKEEEKSEKLEGDAALNNLFQQIYGDGTDETKKAMMKSFYESGGTVLSTNWNEVGKQKVDMKPPDGMEFKKWDS